MNYLDELRAAKAEKGLGSPLTKPTERPQQPESDPESHSVGSVGTQGEPFPEFRELYARARESGPPDDGFQWPTADELAELDALLVEYGRLTGEAEAVTAEYLALRKRMSPQDARDALTAFRRMVAERRQ